MKRQKLLIIVLFQNLMEEEPYYARTPAPPLPGIWLAGMTPDIVDVEVLHEMVRPIDYDTDADFIAISFMDYLAPHAYEVAEQFRKLGKVVVGGGKFASTFPEEVAPHFDSILVGEAQGIWPQMVHDLVNQTLKPRYDADPLSSLENIPPPRYDLVERRFTVPVVTEATRGCPHPCTFCQLNIIRLPHRMRPVEDVIRDLKSTHRLPWYRRKMAMVLDNNLGGDLSYAKSLLREIARLDFWGIGTQFSIECLRDNEFVDLLAKAHCRMAFLGMESLSDASLAGVKKKQNKVGEYRESFDKLHKLGILTFTGLMFALDNDTKEYYDVLPQKLEEVGTCVILPSISIPLYGTPWHREVAAQGRIVDTDISHYEGDHLVFRHPTLSADEVYAAYKSVNRIFYRWRSIVRRWWKFIRLQSKQESLPRYILRLFLSTFIYFKLSLFQRHHAQHRVFPALASRVREEKSGDIGIRAA
ncbi:MAG TPA: radical SAM protein [Bacteroidota bacterium]|nr:radical SAM protein [Bacteroidota bacterium]